MDGPSQLPNKFLSEYVDERGTLSLFLPSDVPFVIERMFIIGDVPQDLSRGGHGHIGTTQFLLCIRGEIEITEIKNGNEKRVFQLVSGYGELILPKRWISMKFLKDAQLVVFADKQYDPDDYFLDPKKYSGMDK